MKEKTETLILKTKKVPFGIISGACAMVVFFSTVGLIIAYAVTSGIAGQTMRTVSFLENWWQGLMFAADIIAALVAVASLVMYVLKRVYIGREEEKEESAYDSQV